MNRKDILKEFDEKILSEVGMNTLEIRGFISQAIDQTKKETREEAIYCGYNLCLKEVLDILNKLKN